MVRSFFTGLRVFFFFFLKVILRSDLSSKPHRKNSEKLEKQKYNFLGQELLSFKQGYGELYCFLIRASFGSQCLVNLGDAA